MKYKIEVTQTDKPRYFKKDNVFYHWIIRVYSDKSFDEFLIDSNHSHRAVIYKYNKTTMKHTEYDVINKAIHNRPISEWKNVTDEDLFTWAKEFIKTEIT